MATYIVKLPQTLDEAKAERIGAIKADAHRLLAATDWYVGREAETGKPTPQSVLDYRAAVRAATDQAEADIAALSTVDEVRAYQIAWPEQ